MKWLVKNESRAFLMGGPAFFALAAGDGSLPRDWNVLCGS